MKDSTWTRISAIAEIISSIAVVVTLLYLAVQTRQNTEATLAATRHTMVTNDLQVLVGDMGVAPTSVMIRENPTTEELDRLESYLIAIVRTREHQWLQYQAGLLDKTTFEAYLTGLNANLSYPRSRAWWEYVSYDYFNHDFVDAVNTYLADYPVLEDLRPMITIAMEAKEKKFQ